MAKRVIASYCTTFLKPEMLHIYRQVTGIERHATFVIAKQRQCEEEYPFEALELAPGVSSNFIRRFWLKYIKKEPPIVYRGEYGVLNRVLERRKAEAMHIYFGHTGVHLLPFIQRWPKPVAVSFHGMDVMPREDKPGYIDRLRDLLQEIPIVMARSESLADRLRALDCPEEKIRLNRTGIPMESFPVVERKRPEDGAWKFVQACRLVEKKGIDVSLRAFARFAATHPKATFWIAGEGPLRAQMEALVDELAIKDKVSFTGFLTGPALCQLFHGSHVFVHPSRVTEDQNQEGIPNSMVEGMATGLPVLATLHGGIPEAVKNGETGLLVPENDEDGLTANMERLAGEDGLWETLSARAAEDVRVNFEASAQVAKLEAIYDELLDGGKR